MAEGISSCSVHYSSYVLELEDKAKKSYLEELALCGGMHDPYLADSTATESSIDWQTWPIVEYPDIYYYLICPTSFYTQRTLQDHGRIFYVDVSLTDLFKETYTQTLSVCEEQFKHISITSDQAQ